MSSTHRISRKDREIRAARTQSAGQAIGTVEPGVNLFILTHGQFSLIDAMVYLSHEIGPCDLSVCTWTAGSKDLQYMADLLGGGDFRSVRWLVDRSFATRQPAYCAKLRDLFGDDVIRTTNTHAKFSTIRNEQFDLAIRSSMNLNQNRRLETMELSDDPAFADFLDAEFDRYFDGQDAGTMGAYLKDEPPELPLETGRATGKRLYSRE